MVQQCRDNGLQDPVWKSEPKLGVTVTFSATEVTTEVTTEVARLLAVMDQEHSRQELQDKLGLRNEEHFRKAYLLPALAAGLIERTIPDKPLSSKQRYRLTRAGRGHQLRILP